MRAIVLRLKGWMGYFGSFYRDWRYVRLSMGFYDHLQAASTKLIDLKNKLKEGVKWNTNQ